MKFFLRYATKAAKPSECCAIATTPNPSSPEEGTTLGVRYWHLLFGQTQGSAPTVGCSPSLFFVFHYSLFNFWPSAESAHARKS